MNRLCGNEAELILAVLTPESVAMIGNAMCAIYVTVRNLCPRFDVFIDENSFSGTFSAEVSKSVYFFR